MRPFVVVVLLILMIAASLTAAPQGVSPRLEQQLDADADPQARLAVWVFFVDKGHQGPALSDALDDAEAALDDRSRRRRSKTQTSGRLVDETDLALHGPYLDVLAGTGAGPRRVSRWLNAASYDATPSQIRAMVALSFVRYVDLVNRFTRDPEPVNPARAFDATPDKADAWTLDYGGSLTEIEQVNVPPVHDAGWNGQGVLIGMLDTGFRTTHEALTGMDIVAMWDFVNNDGVVENQIDDPSNAQNHGTMTLSTIGGYLPGSLVGPAFGASFILAKTEDVADELPIEEDNWVAGIEWLDTFGIDIASSSLGYTDWYVFEDMDGATAPCTIAADLAVSKGIVVVNSAGNDRASTWGHIIAPADGDSVLTVGAVNSSGVVTSFSSPGPTADGRIKPDVAAMGAGNHVASPADDGAYLSVSGTSFSCPLTAGVSALVLSRVPELTPMQVIEALRMTASQNSAPDNDLGWGIVDAWDAVHYFGAVFDHTPRPDTEQTAAPIPVSCTITNRVALDPAALELWWRVDDGAWQSELLVSTGGDGFTADIAAQPTGGLVDYYLAAGDVLNLTIFDPAEAPTLFHSFAIGPDVTPPVIAHQGLGDQALITWPAVIAAMVTDNLGVAEVNVDWTLNGLARTAFPLADMGNDRWSGVFPIAVESLVAGDVISYEVSAVDASSGANTATSGPLGFTIIDAVGVVLVADDTLALTADSGKFDEAKNPVPPTAPILAARSSADDAARWLADAGYVVHRKPFPDLTVGDLTGIQALVITSGGNASPLEDTAARNLVRDWVVEGGRLFIEGGEVGFDALGSPGYPDFAAVVLHADSWRGDAAGDLRLQADNLNHPVATDPHILPAALSLEYSSYSDQDAIDPAAGAQVVFDTASVVGSAGLLVYDDNTAPLGGQIVYLAANLAALTDTVSARHLVENAVAWLVADEGEATASFAGLVSRHGQDGAFEPVAGAVVTVIGAGADTTGADGRWRLDDLYAGTYQVSAAAFGLATEVRMVALAQGQSLTHVDFVLPTTWDHSVDWIGPAPIPDDDPAGVAVVWQVTTTDPVADVGVTIDLDHAWIGDLIVELVSPEGTTIRLHDRSGSIEGQIVGTWGTTLTVDGPGSLSDVSGENPSGDWILRVSDLVANDTGTLNSCSLNLVLRTVTTGVDGGAPTRTALLPNVPNPFNPRTTIGYGLRVAGVPSLTVYDLRGRMVRELLDGSLQPAGRHTSTWDGRDADGRSVPTGVYLVRLRAGDDVDDRKITLTR